MPSPYTVKFSKHAVLATADTTETVTLTADFNQVQIVSRGNAELYYTLDGTTPTVGGDDTYVVPAYAADEKIVRTAGDTVVKVRSAAAIPYSVTGLWT